MMNRNQNNKQVNKKSPAKKDDANVKAKKKSSKAR